MHLPRELYVMLKYLCAQAEIAVFQRPLDLDMRTMFPSRVSSTQERKKERKEGRKKEERKKERKKKGKKKHDFQTKCACPELKSSSSARYATRAGLIHFAKRFFSS